MASYFPTQQVATKPFIQPIMTPPVFRYGEIKSLMTTVIYKLEEAGHPEEAAAMRSLTHLIACRVEPPDVSNEWGVEYLLECLEYHNSLLRYINGSTIDDAGQP